VFVSSSRGSTRCTTSSQHPSSVPDRRRPGVAGQPETTSTTTPVQVWTCHEDTRTSRTCRPAHAALEAILGELRTVTGRMRADDERTELTAEWKHAAMVVDRCCLWTFTAFTAILTLSTLLSAPHLFVL